MLTSLDNFIELFELNIHNSKFSKRLIILFTAEYEEIAVSVFNSIRSSFDVSLKKLQSIFDENLESYILEKDIFLLFYSMPWEDLKKYYAVVRPVLTRHTDRSYIIRDCLNDFDKIYAASFNKISNCNNEIIRLGNNTRKVLIKNELGTHLEFTFEREMPWRSIDGTNIPNEIVPAEVSNYTPLVNGRVVFTGIMVSLVPIGKKYGHIKEPIFFDIENGCIKKVSCENKALEQDLLKIYDYCAGNSEIVELGIGTNLAIELIGISAPFEERKAGFHLGTGGYKAKSQHIDFVFDSSEIYFDDYCIFSNNQFHIS